jgi:DDE superfamily endonuclease
LNPFPTRHITAQTLPVAFQKFSNIRCIIDSTELFVDQASTLTTQSLTFSNYEHHSTLKFLVAMVPTGGICFVSNGWSGRISDRCVTEKSGFLDKIMPGDLVMAGEGFTIGDLLAEKGAFLQEPPLLANKGQIQPEDVDLTRQTARILVERAIGRVKQYHILDPVLPLSPSSTISSVFRVCCFLSNVNPPLDS